MQSRRECVGINACCSLGWLVLMFLHRPGRRRWDARPCPQRRSDPSRPIPVARPSHGHLRDGDPRSIEPAGPLSSPNISSGSFTVPITTHTQTWSSPLPLPAPSWPRGPPSRGPPRRSTCSRRCVHSVPPPLLRLPPPPPQLPSLLLPHRQQQPLLRAYRGRSTSG